MLCLNNFYPLSSSHIFPWCQRRGQFTEWYLIMLFYVVNIALQSYWIILWKHADYIITAGWREFYTLFMVLAVLLDYFPKFHWI
jgi:hypothetical protein